MDFDTAVVGSEHELLDAEHIFKGLGVEDVFLYLILHCFKAQQDSKWRDTTTLQMHLSWYKVDPYRRRMVCR